MKKVWIYQADRFLTQPEYEEASTRLQDFIQEWTAHGSQLAGKAEIKYNLFIILIVDEEVAQVTGCSIDKSVRVLKELEESLNIGFFNRTLIPYRDVEGNIQLVSRDVFEELCKQGEVHQDTIVFNNLAQTESEYQQHWEVPFKDSWHATVFK
ncbi:ABC transporter ATPase [Sphingobacterium lactis]|uniref:ABC transporter ATPase n=1 Tax=Sphingobacterium lactis TaxID=797291 RepID=UPI003DA44069